MRLDNLTFKGGLHVKEYKELSEKKAIEKALEPKIVYIPLHQHVGAPCKALVKAGDLVKVGQKIGDVEASMTAPVHSSVSGEVKKIEKMYTPDGYNVECVVIESDGLSELHESVKPKGSLENLSKDEIVSILREAGIAGMGGAGFPMHSKLATAQDAKIDTVILNGAECEPYLTCDHRVMLEMPELVIYGLEVMLKYFDGAKGYIGIEDNKMDAVEMIEKTLEGHDNIDLAVLKTKFPQGDSYRMVNAITKRLVPKGGRSKDVQCIVGNVGSAAAAAEAIIEGKPLFERVVTVTGNGVSEPKNLMVKIGTPIGDLIKQCGGFKGNPGKIIVGGPMTGFAQFNLDTPVTKTVTGIVVMTEEETRPVKVSPCIKCSKCLDVCPVYLEPVSISAYSLKNRFDDAEALNAMSCISCGACSYTCPAKRPLAESIAHAKAEIKAKRKK